MRDYCWPALDLTLAVMARRQSEPSEPASCRGRWPGLAPGHDDEGWVSTPPSRRPPRGFSSTESNNVHGTGWAAWYRGVGHFLGHEFERRLGVHRWFV